MNTTADYHVIKNENELNDYYNIRRKVFIKEQSCPEEIEIDEYEEDSIHFIGLFNGKAACTSRLRFIGDKAKFERLAVLKKYRKYGLGRGMLEHVLAYIDKNNYKTTVTHAQSYLLKFYEDFGFVKEGSEFLEAGIKHYLMSRHKS